ncbi:LAME_0E07140g1_1 [Lachancea meyersii CBS 8951]|uniref:LAME_0E07140g1_1 n=1 Tax=Lachancea meyersii CBS 8951 TaxID=1266667 RepID=A0A1G4JIE2_9SACH|nr:LAME_0E07140g1_1 [Lachancea meyersii CBS 8951]
MLTNLNQLPLLAVAALFVFTTFILTIVATAGSTSNYSPINNVYLGEADISRINVTKVIPETASLLSVVVGLFNSTSSNSSESANSAEIFDALRSVSHTSALKPMLELFAESNNVSETVSALGLVAPVLASASASSGSSQLLTLVGQLIQDSKSPSETVEGMGQVLQSSNSTDSTSQRAVFALLSDSNNATASVDSLVVLQNQSSAERAQLTPVLTLFQQSSNATATLGALSTLMTANVSNEMSASLLNALRAGSSNPQAALNQVLNSVPDSVRPAVLAVGTLLNNTRDSTQTLTTLEGLLQANVTTSPNARRSFGALTTLVSNSNNQTLVLTSVATLANSTSSASTAQLLGLQDILDSSTNSTKALSVLQQLQSSNSTSSSQSLTPIFGLIGDSKNSTATIESIMGLTQAFQANSTAFQPLLKILSQTELGSTEITQDTLNNVMPIVLDNLGVDSRYRLAIFTLCSGLSNGNIQQCSSPHAVQSFVLRDILYDQLENSDFQPYMQALDVQKNDMYLEGKLQNKQDSYVPALRAVLAFNLLTIILAFLLLVLIVCIMLSSSMTDKLRFWLVLSARVLAFLVTLFVLLSAAIVAAFVSIIKRDTKADDYNVTFATGSAYAGLIWTSFVLALITFVALFFVRSNRRAGALTSEEVGSADATVSSSEKRNGTVAHHSDEDAVAQVA